MIDAAKLVLCTIHDHQLISGGDRVLVAVSGGGDSVALLWLLKELVDSGRLDAQIAGIVHVNHQLRGDESARDEQFCRALANRAGLPIEVFSIGAAAAAREARRSIESVARELRYACFREAAARLRATRIATGHTEDDQAETVLLRLLRGAGTRGVSGIRMRRGQIIRPLLSCRRADLRNELAARREPFCEDSSNSNVAVPRNRVRHVLLPAVDAVAPAGVAALARFAAMAAADEAYLESEAVTAARRVVDFDAAGTPAAVSSVQLNVGELTKLPLPIARRVIRLAGERLVRGGSLGPASISSGSINKVWKLAAGEAPRGRASLSGFEVERVGLVLSLRPADPRGQASSPRFERLLPVPGTVDLPAGRALTAALEPAISTAALRSYSGDSAAIQASTVRLPLTVRGRRPGDRLRPFGSPGSRKLKAVLIDRKIPRPERDNVPVVVDADGRIVWVAGLTIAEHCRVTSPDTGVVVLKLGRTSVEPVS